MLFVFFVVNLPFTPPHQTEKDPQLTSLEGRCLCGAVTITVEGQHERTVGACHCRLCQRWTGGIFFCFAAAPDAVRIEGAVAHFRSTPFAERAFCPTCGAHLYFRDLPDENAPDKIRNYELMPGLFSATRDWPLRSEVYADRASAFAHLTGDHPRKSRAEYEAKNLSVPGDFD